MTGKKIHRLSRHKQDKLINDIILLLQKEPGIAQAYQVAHLASLPTQIGSVVWLLQNNIYQGRSGDIIIQISPYTLVSKYASGTKHDQPYSYNTHVPLMLYQAGSIERKTIMQRVWIQ